MQLSVADLLESLNRDDLNQIADHLDLHVEDRRVRSVLRDAIATAPHEPEEVLETLSRDRLKELCREFDLDDTGREKRILVERLIEHLVDEGSASNQEVASTGSSGDASTGTPDELEPYECEPGALLVEEEPEDRAYQAQALHELNSAFQHHCRVVLSLPTGAGKTFVAAKWLADNLKGKALWLTHRAELVRQADDELRRVFGKSKTTTQWTSADKDDSGDVVIASVGCNRLPDCVFEVLVVDEAHHRAAPSYKEWARCYRFRKELGLTATPERHDQLKLGYDAIVKRSFWELVQNGYLAAPQQNIVKTRQWYQLRKDAIRDDFEEASLRQLDNPERNRVIVETYLQHEAQYGKTLIFAINVAHAHSLLEAFRKRAPNVRVATILGTTNRDERANVVDDFERGRLDVLINCKVFVEGFNCKDIQTIFITRPTMSATLYCQMVGRGTRVTATKRTFHLVEFEDQLSAFADKLAGFWILDPEGNQQLVRDATERAKQRAGDPPLLIAGRELVEWQANLHRIAGVLAYWDRLGLVQGATLIHAGEVVAIRAAFAGPAVERRLLREAIGGGHWALEEREQLELLASSEELSFHLYDFQQAAPAPEVAPPAVAAIHTAVKQIAPLSEVEAFLGTADNIDWGANIVEWRQQFLAERAVLSGVLRVVDEFSGRVTPQKVFAVDVAGVRAGLAQLEAASSLNGEQWYAQLEQSYAQHLTGTTITKYKWQCVARSLRKGERVLLKLDDAPFMA